jgi:hypothetical protein
LAQRETLPPENAIAYPSPGEVLLIAYGPSRFACMAGPLAGNPVLSIEDGLARLIVLGRQILWHGTDWRNGT